MLLADKIMTFSNCAAVYRKMHVYLFTRSKHHSAGTKDTYYSFYQFLTLQTLTVKFLNVVL